MTDAQQPEFAIQKIYTKDISFEAPHTPQMFQEEWKPELNLNLQTITTKLQEGVFDVVLTVTVTVTNQTKTAFIAEVKQAGIFTINHFPAEQMGPVQGSVCPSILFPYAREAISDIVTRGGFPQLSLAPINFDALYAQQVEQQQASTSAGEVVH